MANLVVWEKAHQWSLCVFLITATPMEQPAAKPPPYPPSSGRHIVEESRCVTLRGSYDVIVCGGGPAGTAAALASARSGARTLLIEAQGGLGGVWTAGLLSWIIDAGNKDGIMAELLEAIDRGQLRTINQRETYGHAFDPEMMKRLLERLCLEAGVTIRLHTLVVGARVEDNRVTHVLTESKSGREAWGATAFVDASGEGDFAAQCGCGFDFGHPQTGRAQPFSLLGLLTGPTLDEMRGYLSGWLDGKRAHEGKANLLADLERAGFSPSYAHPTLMPIHCGLYMLMANHEYAASALNADDISRATLQARAELHGMVDGLRSLGGTWRNVRLVASGEQIGLREGRRIHGLYTVTLQDMIEGVRHDDSVCRVNFGLDVHSTDPATSKTGDASVHGQSLKTQPYDIPLRALIARDVDGLLMAGRCISGDFLAHSSYRVTGNSVALGEAAGRTAAHAIQQGLSPRALLTSGAVVTGASRPCTGF